MWTIEEEDDHNIDDGNGTSHHQWDLRDEKVQCNGKSNHLVGQHPSTQKIETGDRPVTYLCYVCGNDCSLGKDVQDVVEPSGEKGTTGFSKVEATDGTELDGEALQENSKQIG